MWQSAILAETQQLLQFFSPLDLEYSRVPKNTNHCDKVASIPHPGSAVPSRLYLSRSIFAEH